MKKQSILLSGAMFCGLAVALGAFGAHAWKGALNELGRLDTFETAVRYQMLHGFALLITGALMSSYDNKKLSWAGICFASGIVFFSGSLYILCATTLTFFGAVTPLGGVLFLIGWTLVALGVRSKA